MRLSEIIEQFGEAPDGYPIGFHGGALHVGNLTGTCLADRELVVCGGQLVPRDLRADERPHTNSACGHALNRNECSSRGWNQIHLSKAEKIAAMRTPSTKW